MNIMPGLDYSSSFWNMLKFVSRVREIRKPWTDNLFYFYKLNFAMPDFPISEFDLRLI